MPQGSPRFPLVFVVGVAHCGSTLLGRLLNMHSRVQCVGELMRLDLALEGDLPCGCGELVDRCPFWADHLPELERETGRDYRRFRRGTWTRIGDALSKDVVVDLSKTRVWRHTRRWRDPEVGTILLVRDSRGVMASAARKGKDLAEPLRKHKKWMKRLQRFVAKKKDRGLVVHYEDLCRDPKAELERICTFLGLEFEPAMLRPADQVHHFVHSSASGYLKASNEIRRDERWREELRPDQVAAIEEVMGQLDCFQGRFESAAAR